jgi:exosortase/archaeosortase family protein
MSRLASATQLLGFFVVASLIQELKSDQVLKRWDLTVLLAAVLACSIPQRFGFAAAATLLGTLFFWRSDYRLSSIGQLSLALAWMDFWGPLAYMLIESWLLPLETALAFVPLAIFTSAKLEGVTIYNGAGHDILIMEGCSAFRNTMTTAFIWLCLLKLQRLPTCRRYVIALGAALIAVVLINTARIAVLSISFPLYEYWHNGLGFHIAKLSMLASVLLIFYIGFANKLTASARLRE